MKSMSDGKRLLVKGSSNIPGGFSKRPEVRIPEIFHGNEAEDPIVSDQPGCGDMDGTEKCCNIGIASVFDPPWVIMDQDG
jgi:hypothetical protein